MKPSQKVFAVLSIGLPLMLMLSMTARAEDGTTGTTANCRMTSQGYTSAYFQCYDGLEKKESNSTACKSSETWQRMGEEFCKGHCSSTTGKCGVNTFSVTGECGGTKVCENTCMDIKPLLDRCANAGGIANTFEKNGCKMAECKLTKPTTTTNTCQDVQPLLDRCAKAGGTATTFEKGGCKYAECKLPSPTTTGSVNCTRTIVSDGNSKCKVYKCDDGTTDRVCGNSQDKPKPLPTAPKGPCTDIERMIIDTKAALEKNPSSVDLQKKLNELTQKFATCRTQNTSSSSSSVGGTSTAACETKIVDGCKVTRCRDGRSFKVCS